MARSTGTQTTTYRYDADNRLVEVKQGATADTAQTIASYTYDGNGNRVAKTETSAQGLKTTSFLVDENQQYAQVLEEREAVDTQGSQTTVSYLYGDDLLNQVREGQRTYYHYDALGSTRALSDGSGNVSDSYRYVAFGSLAEQGGKTVNPYRFAGERFDPSLGMYYLRARYYEPLAGRFSEMDPLAGSMEQPITLNDYLYANADPANALDPSGEETLVGLSAGMEGMLNLALQTVRADLFNLAFNKLADSLVNALARGATPSLSVPGNPSGAALLSTLAVMCLQGKRKCLLKSAAVPTLVVGATAHGRPLVATSVHISSALYGYGNTQSGGGVSPFVLFRKSPPHSRSWIKRQGRCSTFLSVSTGVYGRGLSCDEYPYASTYQGGLANYKNDIVSLAQTPASEDGPQGGVLSAFYSRAPVRVGRPFINLAVPVLPFSFYINSSGTHRF